MKNFNLPIFSSLFALLLSPFFFSAKAEPTLQETLAYIHNKVMLYESVTGSGGHFELRSGCEFRVISRIAGSYDVNLREMAINQTRRWANSVVLQCRQANCIERTRSRTAERLQASEVYIPALDGDVDRILRAFQHAMRLCGSRSAEELF